MTSRSEALQRPALEAVLARIEHLAPVSFVVNLSGPLAVHLVAYAMAEGVDAETIIAEAVRSYLGDAT
jgi:hypothetical protein